MAHHARKVERRDKCLEEVAVVLVANVLANHRLVQQRIGLKKGRQLCRVKWCVQQAVLLQEGNALFRLFVKLGNTLREGGGGGDEKEEGENKAERREPV